MNALTIVTGIIEALFPKAPAWLLTFLVEVIPLVFNIVEALKASDAEGAEKFEVAVVHVGDALDDALDGVPEWGELDEEQRDRILGGLVELALWVSKLVDKYGKKKAKRKLKGALKKLRDE